MASDRRVLPYGRQNIDDEDIAAVVDVLRGDWLTTGPAVEGFEKALAERVGARFAIVCSSGTAALHLAALAMQLDENDTVLVPSITFVATANGARYAGAKIAFTDVDPLTGLMRPDDLRRALDALPSPPKAVFPVHLAGQSADSAEILAIARDAGCMVVEDACHALGTRYGDKNAGDESHVGGCRHSDMAVFSFHPVKTIAMGEGGAITTNDPDLDRRLRSLRSHGIVRDATQFKAVETGANQPGPWYYEMQELGYNYRASDIHCALGLSQIGKLDRFVTQREKLVDHYREALRPLAPRIRPLNATESCRPAWHLFVALLDFAAIGRSRADVMAELSERGVYTQVHYIPVYRHPYYADHGDPKEFPGAEQYYAAALTLPLHVGMSEDDVDYVVAALRQATQ